MRDSQGQHASERPFPRPRYSISRLAFLLAGLLIALTSASLVFVGYTASSASNEQAVRNEQRLFDNALQHKIKMIVREQMSVTRKDSAVTNFVLTFNYEYVREHLRGLWAVHQHDRSLIISPDDVILAEGFKDYIHITNQKLQQTPVLLPLVEEARTLFDKNRVRVPGGYSYRSLYGLDLPEFAAVGFVTLDTRTALVSVTPFIPDREKVRLPDGGPTLLVSARFIDERFLSEINTQLSFNDLRFVDHSFEEGVTSKHEIKDLTDTPLGRFQWTSQAPSDTIWPMVIPVILALSLILAILAFGIAWKIGRLTSSLQASERRNRFLALHDTLTGLANRLQFNRALKAALNRAADKPVTVIHCDLDEFKAINDTYGHAAGDKVIRTVAKRMKERIGRKGLVCRIGGDEFIILMQGKTGEAKLAALCSALIQSVSKPVTVTDNETACVGLSIGVARAFDQSLDGETLVAAADAALYDAKSRGRGRFAFADDVAAAGGHQDDFPAQTARQAVG